MDFSYTLLKFKKHVGFEPSSIFSFVYMGVGNFCDKLNKLIDFDIGSLEAFDFSCYYFCGYNFMNNYLCNVDPHNQNDECHE